jgi:hypothetical protein
MPGIPAEYWPWSNPFFNWSGPSIVVSGGGASYTDRYTKNNQAKENLTPSLKANSPSVGLNIFSFHGGANYLEIVGDGAVFSNENLSFNGRAALATDFIGVSLGARATSNNLRVRAITILCREVFVGGTVEIGAIGARAFYNPTTGVATAGISFGVGGSVRVSSTEVGFPCICCT